MIQRTDLRKPVLLIGEGELMYSIAVCVSQGDFPIFLVTPDPNHARRVINEYIIDMSREDISASSRELTIFDDVPEGIQPELVIISTPENLAEKKKWIHLADQKFESDVTIAINTESTFLSLIQEGGRYPQRILGMNWTYPAHTTLFLELIANDVVDPALVCRIKKDAECWGKDPYLVSGESGIRSRLMAAMAREAFYLVENGYASVKDIDRAFRNDAGYYLPFVGIFRYIDLTGASVYGKVMKDLNPELSKSKILPEFFQKLVDRGDIGMKNDKGFYIYDKEVKKKIENRFQEFSYAIREITYRRPAEFMKQETTVSDKKK